MSRKTIVAALALAAVTIATLPVFAASQTVLYSFQKAKYGEPVARLMFQNGHLFGTTTGNHGKGDGIAFELFQSGGAWKKKTVINVFNQLPLGGLIRDSNSYLYGSLCDGGTFNRGWIFSLHYANGSWTETGLWNSENDSDGQCPSGELFMDGSGNLFATTQYGGKYGDGAVIELTPSNGNWAETVIHDFNGKNGDGIQPLSGLRTDDSGVLYGTTYYGGISGYGTVYELVQSGGAWIETILYNFCSSMNCMDGAYPAGDVILDANGKLYGTTAYGGSYLYGEVFELYKYGGLWNELTLWNFDGGSDGAYPEAGLHLSASGILYGTTYGGGTDNYGTVFKTPRGVHRLKTLHWFTGSDGANPVAGVITDKNGNLYGTTYYGGADDAGTVWEVVP